ncbi:MAG: dihydroneopterin aldolase [Propionibacteriaceae bacterium]|jgi:dihydroneopterin aldolase/2-amino-4-hydroxy-6-hydroxymethyldihydropteridine diphosphokinase|nr:dihydroneopterin aldolase [Propionibacteriaceae bacterium]
MTTRPLTPADLDRLATLDRGEVVGLEAWAYHGVFDQERRDGQRFLVDVTWWQDLRTAAASDNLAQATDYGALAQAVITALQAAPVALIETLAARLQATLLDRFPMEFVQVTVHKPDAPLGLAVADVRLASAVARATPPREVVFSLGSNVEPCRDYLQFAVTALAATPGIEAVRVSPVYATAPVPSDTPLPPQADFLNAVLVATSALPAPALVRRGLAIEALAGRDRSGPPHGPRTLDIDLIQAGAETSPDPDCVIPHPRAAARAFVLVPWLGLDPSARLGDQLVRQLSTGVRDQVITRLPDRLFTPDKV